MEKTYQQLENMELDERYYPIYVTGQYTPGSGGGEVLFYIKANGDIFLRGKIIANDKQVADALTKSLQLQNSPAIPECPDDAIIFFRSKNGGAHLLDIEANGNIFIRGTYIGQDIEIAETFIDMLCLK